MRFAQLHILTTYPPSNLNRDDLGRPKTALYGDKTRLRVSSQSLKRAWRESDVFKEHLDGAIGTRTRSLGLEVFDRLREGDVDEDQASEWAREIASRFAKVSKGELRAEQLVHISPREYKAAMDLADTLTERGDGPTDEELDLLRTDHGGADIAAFGRMLADSPAYNVEAAIQVSHALTVNAVTVEDDFFSAVDDLNTGEEDKGSGHMGEHEFGSGTFYLYVCVDRDLLRENLDGDEQLAGKVMEAITRAATTVSPTGKQASYASRSNATYAHAELGDQQPRTLATAFLDPVSGPNFEDQAIARLEDRMEKMDKVYGPCADKREQFNALEGEGNLEALAAFMAG